MMRRVSYLAVVSLMVLVIMTAPAAAVSSATWSTASDWDNAVSGTGVVHDSYGDRVDDEFALGYSSFDANGSGLEMFWPLDEDSGSTANDASSNSHDGAIDSGGSLGQNGIYSSSAFNLDEGEDVYNSNIDAASTGAVSSSMWVKFNNAGTTGTSYYLGHYSGSNSYMNVVIDCGANEIGFMFNSGSADCRNSGVAPSSGWTHIAAVVSQNNVKIYINGSLELNSSHSYDITQFDDEIILNDFKNDGGNGVDALYDEVRIYNRTLSKSDVARQSNKKGHLETSTKSFSTTVNVNLSASTTLNGQTANVTVIGSPNSGSEEKYTVALNGSGGPYDINMASPHTDYRLNTSLSSSSPTQTPKIQSLSLNPTVVGNTYNISGTVTDSSGSKLNGVTVEAVNQSSNNVDAVASTDNNGDYDMSVSNSTYTVRAYDLGYSKDTMDVVVNGADVSGVDLTLPSDAPIVDDSSASPSGSYVGSSTTTLEVDVNDAQFNSLGGESVTVEYFDKNGNSLASDTLTSAGTASSGSVATPSEWYVVATDDVGLTDTSKRFNITVPPNVRIYDESNDSLLSTTAYLEVESLDSSYQNNFTINNGKGKIDPPRQERLHVDAKATGYVDRDFLLINYTRDYPLVILPTTDPDSERYEQCFDFVDDTGNYPTATSFLVVQTEVDSQNTSYPGMVSSGYFGSENLECAFLVDSKPYTLLVQNNDGDAHSFGDYIAQNDGTIETLNIGPLYDVPITPGNDIDPGRYASVLRDEQNNTVSFEYVDHSGDTTQLNWSYIKTNESGTFSMENDSAPGQFGSFKDTQTVNEVGVDWKVNYTAKSNGTVVEQGVVRSGGLRPIDGIKNHIDQKWLEIISVITIVGLGGLIVPSDPRLAGTSMVLLAIVLTMFGWITIPFWALGPAAAAALIFQIAGQEGSRV